MEKGRVANVLLRNTSWLPSNGLKPNASRCEGMEALKVSTLHVHSCKPIQTCVGHSFSLTAGQAIFKLDT